jgi:ubiquinone/menaquinone biosynthesis C-methylase UbiE
MTVEEINKLSYTDFVGLVNQWNVPPGAYSTINQWAIFGKVEPNSNILELACTTGFSIRELSLLTKCKGIGIDISEASVNQAIQNKNLYAVDSDIQYQTIDAHLYKPEGSFTHLVIGAALRFFPNPQQILERYINFLESTGYILSAEFYTNELIPDNLINEAKTVFDIYPTNISYKKVMAVYKNLELIYENKCLLEQETVEELNYYCKCTIDRLTSVKPEFTNPDLYKATYERLYKIKDMSNKLRPYQRYSVLVHRYRSNLYPARYVELF